MSNAATHPHRLSHSSIPKSNARRHPVVLDKKNKIKSTVVLDRHPSLLQEKTLEAASLSTTTNLSLLLSLLLSPPLSHPPSPHTKPNTRNDTERRRPDVYTTVMAAAAAR